MSPMTTSGDDQQRQIGFGGRREWDCMSPWLRMPNRSRPWEISKQDEAISSPSALVRRQWRTAPAGAVHRIGYSFCHHNTLQRPINDDKSLVSLVEPRPLCAWTLRMLCRKCQYVRRYETVTFSNIGRLLPLYILWREMFSIWWKILSPNWSKHHVKFKLLRLITGGYAVAQLVEEL